jgi:hypothetical protein
MPELNFGLLKDCGVLTNFVRGGREGVQQIQLRTESRENEDLGAVAPTKGFRSICKRENPVFFLGCYGCIFARN